MSEINRHRLLSRKVRSGSPEGILLECGHLVTPDQVREWATRMTLRGAPAAYVYCQVCASSPHSVTNPEALQRLWEGRP